MDRHWHEANLIYILDNGEKYSAHEIAFVDTSEPITRMSRVAELTGWQIIGIADRVEWREPLAVATLEQWMPTWSISDLRADDPDTRLLDMFPVEFWERVFAAKNELYAGGKHPWLNPDDIDGIRKYFAAKDHA